MSARAAKPSPRKQPERPEPPPAAEGSGIVQQVLAERRELLVANERLRLELEESRGRAGRRDPRLHVLELENRALRDELAAARAELERFEDSVAALVEEMRKASP
jgi:hypothetical protein